MNQIQLRLLRSYVHEICLLHNKRALFRLNRQNPCDKKRHTTAQLKLCQPPPVGTQHSCSLSASKAPEILVADTVEQEAQMSHRKSLHGLWSLVNGLMYRKLWSLSPNWRFPVNFPLNPYFRRSGIGQEAKEASWRKNATTRMMDRG